ncbi:EAL domain-containing protein [Anaerotignum sp. MB30-C6]|uniref:EAL domain-containing protein n=1 Tax=Anaerotignum sp. MB30-C6 TaxID=3070814 RepID=UPI0027DCA4CD|nr:EAL domain-containing protein [Anaerotignum sp. MB30-C6]WMI82327.1 EAL domain-containing protein [Anaerotignum sp. MB30-C6]
MANTEVNKKTILIADDAEINRLLLKKIFGEEYFIEEAANGLEALQKLREMPEIAVLILDIMMPKLDGFGVLEVMQKDEHLRTIPTVVITANNEEDTQIRALSGGATDVLTKPFSSQIIMHRIKNIMTRREAEKLAEQNRAYKRELRLMYTDEKSGLYNKNAFHRYTARMLEKNHHKKFLLFRWDIDNFKVFNDWFGTEVGDEYLKKIGDFYRKYGKQNTALMTYARYDADHFVCCQEAEGFNPEAITKIIDEYMGQLKNLDFEYTPRVGIYMINDPTLDVALMCDRALLALRSIKDSYGKRFAWFDDSMRESMIEQQEIVNEMEFALKDGQFSAYLQPQYNYDNGRLIGAEALVRWKHPVKGDIMPSKFIPLFERNGFISKLDEYIWEQICILLRKWKDEGIPLVPISVNVSRRDIYNPHLFGNILALLGKYNLDPALLHLEITESAYTQNAEQLVTTVNLLRSHGLKVHMDDFGSGYSSLSMLQDVPVDLLKLDMRFLGNDYKEERSGNILNAVVRMATALQLPVLAEGVETKEQADFLRSIGCLRMQGYFFARPMPTEEFEELLTSVNTTSFLGDSFVESIEGSVNFLSFSFQSALLFNSFVGGAAVAEYDKRNETFVTLRINDQFLTEIGTDRTQYMERGQSVFDYYENENKQIVLDMLNEAIATDKEACCEVLTRVTKKSDEYRWLKLRTRLLVASSNRHILYVVVENITCSKEKTIAYEDMVEKLTTLTNNIPGGIGIFEVADKMQLVYCNDTMAVMFGYTHEEFMQKFANSFIASIHPQDREVVEKSFSCLLNEKKLVENCKYRQICKDGSWRWVNMYGRLMAVDGRIPRICALIMDTNT